MQAGRLPIWRNAIDQPQQLARAVCVVIVATFVGLELWTAFSAHLETPASSNSHTTATAQSTASVEQIVAADLFGHAANANSNLPETNLQVTLRAVFAASDPKAASAVIESNDGRTQIIKVGGTLDGSTTLQAVHPNRVVLMRNGELETLYFPVPQESPAVLASTQTPALPTGAPPVDGSIPPNASAEEIKRAAIMQRLEELRARTPR